jgi:opacity protein-like surface antigen
LPVSARQRTLATVQASQILSILIVATTPQADVSGLEVSFASALFAQTPPDDVAAPTPPEKKEFGAKDSWRWMVQGGVGFEVSESSNAYGLLGGGVSYFFIDDLSLDLELNGMYFNQHGEDAVGFNFALLFRWHFVARESWSIYLDGGAGLLLTTDKVPAESPQEPAGGSKFNFTPQGGVGFTYAFDGQQRFFAGLRWYHISNAQIFDSNPGRDSLYFYAGASFPF